VRVGNHRQPGDVRGLVVRGLGNMLLRLVERVARDQRLQVGILVAEKTPQVDDAFAGDGAIARALRGLERREFHRVSGSRVRIWEKTVLPMRLQVRQSWPPDISTKRPSGSVVASRRAPLRRKSSLPQASHT